MQDLEKLERELARSGKKDALQRLAASEDGRRLSGMIDADAAQEALQSGDSATLNNRLREQAEVILLDHDPVEISSSRLRQLLRGVLSTDEGRRLAADIQSLMGTK